MKERVIPLIAQPLSSFDVWVDDVVLEEEEGILYFRIVLDSESIIDLDKVVEITRVIDPIITQADLIDNRYVLDIYAKEKGESR